MSFFVHCHSLHCKMWHAYDAKYLHLCQMFFLWHQRHHHKSWNSWKWSVEELRWTSNVKCLQRIKALIFLHSEEVDIKNNFILLVDHARTWSTSRTWFWASADCSFRRLQRLRISGIFLAMCLCFMEIRIICIFLGEQVKHPSIKSMCILP